MFLLKFLFVLLLIAFIIILAYTIYTKVTNPKKAFMDCIPFMDEIRQNSANDVGADSDSSPPQAEPLKVVATETKVSSDKAEKPKLTPKPAKAKTAAVKKKPAATKTAAATKKTTKKPTKTAKSKTAAKKDNIKKINGIGPVFEKKLNSIGITKFEHIAAWSDADASRIDEQLELSGRPQREDWIAKAKILAAEKNA